MALPPLLIHHMLTQRMMTWRRCSPWDQSPCIKGTRRGIVQLPLGIKGVREGAVQGVGIKEVRRGAADLSSKGMKRRGTLWVEDSEGS